MHEQATAPCWSMPEVGPTPGPARATGTTARGSASSVSTRRLAAIAAGVAVLGFAAVRDAAGGMTAEPGAGITTILLRPSAEVTHAGPVALAALADISGPQAKAVGAIVLDLGSRLGDGHERLDVGEIRSAIAAASERGAGVNAGRVTVAGSAIDLRVRAMLAEATAEPSTGGTSADAAESQGPLHAAIVANIAATLGVEASEVRATFEPRDAGLLATPLEGRRLILEPQGGGDRVPMSVRVLEGDRVVASGTTRVGISVRRWVGIATRAVARGSMIAADGVSWEERWLPPSVSPASMEEVSGSEARHRLDSGEVILAGAVRAPMVVKSGDLVSVDAVAGGVVVRRTMRAMDDARDGERIRLRTLEGRVELFARMNGRGRAVVLVEDQAADAPTGGTR